MWLIDFDVHTVRPWVRKMQPGRYVLRQLLGDLWTITLRPRTFGKEFRRAVEAGLIPRVRLVGKRSGSLLYEVLPK
jgi:hypothetical protein